MIQKYIPLILIILLVAAILYGFFFIGSNPTIVVPVQPNKTIQKTSCMEGEIRDCVTEKSCNGKEQCIYGVWTGCTIETLCTPGKKTTCSEEICAIGYKFCNKCGTGFGECIINTSVSV